jgi:hypothetical protein
VAAYIGSVLADVCTSHCSGIESTPEQCDIHTSASVRPANFGMIQFGNYINTVPDTLLFITDTSNICSHITTDLITH